MLSKNRFDVKEYINYMSELFDKEDAFRKEFVAKFKSSVHPILFQFNDRPILPIGLHSHTEEYAISIISTVHAVVDKDKHSTSYKMKEEIKALQKLIDDNQRHISSKRSKAVFKIVKQHIDVAFPETGELSTLGNQLLYTNLQWLHINYVARTRAD